MDQYPVDLLIQKKKKITLRLFFKTAMYGEIAFPLTILAMARNDNARISGFESVLS